MKRGVQISWRRRRRWTSLAVVVVAVVFSALLPPLSSSSDIAKECPSSALPMLLQGAAPAGRTTPKYNKLSAANLTREECFARCCGNATCNVAFMYLNKKGAISCYGVSCERSEDCLPSKQRRNGRLTSMGLVRPVGRSEEWADVPGFNLSPFEGT